MGRSGEGIRLARRLDPKAEGSWRSGAGISSLVNPRCTARRPTSSADAGRRSGIVVHHQLYGISCALARAAIDPKVGAPGACTLILLTTVGSAQTCRPVVAFRSADRPPLDVVPSLASARSGACAIFSIAELARQIDGEVWAVSALCAPGHTSLVGRGLRRLMVRDVDARASWHGVGGAAPATWADQAGQAT